MTLRTYRMIRGGLSLVGASLAPLAFSDLGVRAVVVMVVVFVVIAARHFTLAIRNR